MQLGGLAGGIYKVCEWIMRLAYVNLLWILFSVIGLIVFGFMPATIALYTVIRKWMMKEMSIPVFRTFFSAYKKNFIHGNIIGLFAMIIGYVLYINFQFISFINEWNFAYLLLTSSQIFIAILYLILLLYLIPVFVHYELSLLQQFKYAILLGLTNLHITISMVLILILVYFVFNLIPGLLFFFGISLGAYFIMVLTLRVFNKISANEAKT
ncbi:putative membrane protein YesL [Evansella vedderi]|uniref:Membrane protein YesL n=1 Tax=Evansella vedderi TaxID=38282 RepID=A0ABU0A0I5_9BACI|nr:YesL family protein [Evansella vedderi]MDQ0256730.1 putative membrane protein YesL [Evansella vedderi]